MSALGQKQTFHDNRSMSALPPKADITQSDWQSTLWQTQTLALFDKLVGAEPRIIESRKYRMACPFLAGDKSQPRGYPFERAPVAIANLVARSGSINLTREACARRQIGKAASRRRAPVSVSQTDRRRRSVSTIAISTSLAFSRARKLRERVV